MNKDATPFMVPDEIVMSKVYQIRGEKVMLDRDLAELYGVETKRLKESVRRNAERFPEDFMFEMTVDEFSEWRTQFATSREDKQGLRYAPFCFTEQGVAMLSSVLNSSRAIQVNIQIIRVFTRLRKMLLTHQDILLKLHELESKVTNQGSSIRQLFDYLRQFINDHQVPRKAVGYGTKPE